MKKKFVAIMMVAAMAASMAACGSDGGSSDTQKGGSSTTTSDVANKDKPLVWFNRQPSNSSTGELDTTALNYNKDTYYVGFDANQGAELQGESISRRTSIRSTEMGMELSDMYLQSVISDTTIQLQEQEVFVRLLEQA